MTLFEELMGIAMKRLNALSVLAFTLFMSIMVSAQAQAFDVGGLSYDVTGANTVEVTGRALTNSDTVIVIPSSVSDSGTIYAVTTIGVQAFLNTALTSVTFLGDFGTFSLDMFSANDSLETICTVEGASGWPQTFAPNTGPSGSVTSTTCTPATPVPALPLFGLLTLGGLLGLFGLRKLKQ